MHPFTSLIRNFKLGKRCQYAHQRSQLSNILASLKKCSRFYILVIKIVLWVKGMVLITWRLTFGDRNGHFYSLVSDHFLGRFSVFFGFGKRFLRRKERQEAHNLVANYAAYNFLWWDKLGTRLMLRINQRIIRGSCSWHPSDTNNWTTSKYSCIVPFALIVQLQKSDSGLNQFSRKSPNPIESV